MTPSIRWYRKHRLKKLAYMKRYVEKNRSKVHEYRLAYYRKNAERMKAEASRWYWQNRERVRRYRRTAHYKNLCKQWRCSQASETLNSKLKYRFGITLDQFKAMSNAQGNVCAICGRTNKRKNRWGGCDTRLVVDHCKEKRIVRGLLCAQCNLAIGLFSHDLKRIMSAVNYLKRNTSS